MSTESRVANVDSPHSWGSPPESKIEGWNYERRSELLGISQGILQAQVTGVMHHPVEQFNENNPMDLVDPERAVDLAKRLIAAVDNARPKL